MNYKILNGDCLKIKIPDADCIFADPPDNIGLTYGTYVDRRDDYRQFLSDCLNLFVTKAPIVWLSFNAQWTPLVGAISEGLCAKYDWLCIKPCVQTFTFGQHCPSDLGNNHRPLWRFMQRCAPLYPDCIRIQSKRQETGDKRADPRGRVPGDVFDFSRVVGNSRQRRRWHPTQLNESLVERCILLSTLPGQHVLDPFGGTGTTLRVCKRIGRRCTLIEIDKNYCNKIAEEIA